MTEIPNGTASLFGRNPDWRRRTLALAAVISLCVFLFGAYARGRWMQEVMGQSLAVAIVAALVAGGVSSWNAYRNDGLLVGWLLTGSFVAPWLLHYNLQYGIYRPFVSAGYVTVAVVGSTVGHVIGIGVRRAAPGESTGLATTLTAVLGPDPTQLRRWGLRWCGLFVIAVGVVSVATPYRWAIVTVFVPVRLFYPVGDVTVWTVVGVGLVLGWVGVAAWPASRGDGVLVSWGTVFAPTFGATASFLLVERVWQTSSVLIYVRIALVLSVAMAVVLGSLGFVIGVVLRRLVATAVRARGAASA